MSCKKSHERLLKLDDSLHNANQKIRDELSSVVRTGDYLWLAFDEGHSLERLKRVGDIYEEHQSFSLTKYLDLPAGENEMDIEGLAYDGTFMWIAGSHSCKRDKPDNREESVKKRIERLSKIKHDPNRYTLARVPLLKDPESGEYHLYKSCPDPNNPKKTLTATKLKGGENYSQLSQVLANDKHFGMFIDIPGKDNGLDIEGIAVMGERIYLGLRGPVLRGWAIILEVRVRQKGKNKLKLKKIGKKGRRYRKHFVNLHGMGIRELAVAQDDLLILAGPTMDCDGTIALYRIVKGLPNAKESLLYNDEIQRLANVTLGHETEYGKDKAEGLTLTENDELLVVYDAPTSTRRQNESDAYADIFTYPEGKKVS
ncbi:MAG: DUF3616 domain-containing protein [Bacteroidota bacterium]